MTTTKRGNAINGDRFEVTHPSAALDAPFTSFIDVSFRGTNHQVLAAADHSGFEFNAVTGEFTVGDMHGYIVEILDTVQTQAAHRYQAIVRGHNGALTTYSYEGADGLLSLVGALGPIDGRLGLTIDPDDDVEAISAPRVALQLEIGVVEITPLTVEVIDQLPQWEGTPVPAGQLYGGRFTDDTPYLTLVTDTCRVLGLPGSGIEADHVAETLAELDAHWLT